MIHDTDYRALGFSTDWDKLFRECHQTAELGCRVADELDKLRKAGDVDTLTRIIVSGLSEQNKNHDKQ